jgi:hypothetical protein
MGCAPQALSPTVHNIVHIHLNDTRSDVAVGAFAHVLQARALSGEA